MRDINVVKSEYFELVKKLNQSNKQKNKETELYFYIDLSDPRYLKFFAAVSNFQKIQLCHKPHKIYWVNSGFSEFTELENYIAQLLRINDKAPDLTAYIKSHIFKLTS